MVNVHPERGNVMNASRPFGSIAALGMLVTTTLAVVTIAVGGASASPHATDNKSSGTTQSLLTKSIMSLTPANLASGALGICSASPTDQRGLTLKSVLASMSPSTRRYTKTIMGLTFAQLAAGAAGSP
jgi:hypothetical protein